MLQGFQPVPQDGQPMLQEAQPVLKGTRLTLHSDQPVHIVKSLPVSDISTGNAPQLVSVPIQFLQLYK